MYIGSNKYVLIYPCDTPDLIHCKVIQPQTTLSMVCKKGLERL